MAAAQQQVVGSRDLLCASGRAEPEREHEDEDEDEMAS